VTGLACEAFGKDCYEVQEGRVQGDELTFFYAFEAYRVDASLTLAADTLSGEYRSDKCNCDIPSTLHRVP
jgi:hypothetical protein